MRVIYLLLFLIGNIAHSIAQDQMPFTAAGRGVAVSFEQDYHALGINPANIGMRKTFRTPLITVGFLENNSAFFSEALSRQEISRTISNSANIQFNYVQKKQAAQNIANTLTSLNISTMFFGASVSLPKVGGLAFSMSDQINFRTRLNPLTSEILFLGKNASYFPQLLLSDGRIIDNVDTLSEETRKEVVYGFFPDTTQAKRYGEILRGSRVALMWQREYNIGYGVQVFDSYHLKLFVGTSIRMVRGFALIDLAAGERGLTRSNISMSPSMGLSFGNASDTTSSGSPTFEGFQNANWAQKTFTPEPVGYGNAFDIGISALINKKITLSLAMTNLNFGQMRWKGNVYRLNNGLLAGVAGYGLDNYNILQSSAQTFEFAGSSSALGWEGSNKIAVEMPSTLRFGGSYEIFKTAHIGFDCIIPLNDVPGNLASTYYGVGFDLNVLRKVVRISSGLNTGGNFANHINIPFGICYVSMKNNYEMGFGFRDFVGYWTNLASKGSTVSFATGFLRFKIHR